MIRCAQLYLALNKPAGVLSAVRDAREKTVIDLLPKNFSGVFPVGRLDKPTRGLLLLTNDGEWSNTVQHPRYEVEKRYRVTLDRSADQDVIARGVELEDGFSRFDSVRLIGSGKVFELTLHEGRKRQIRRTFEAMGLKVIDLVRIGIGGINLGDLPEGHVRILERREIDSINHDKHGKHD